MYKKSYLKWAGGKGKALKHLLPVLEAHRQPLFCEPFVGAANVSLNFEAESYLLGDMNSDLIISHAVLSHGNMGRVENTDQRVERYIRYCERLFVVGFDKYKEYRDEFNRSKPRVVNSSMVANSAYFQYLNKHGFNGLMRYNKSGKFNTPIGTITKSPKRVPVESIWDFHNHFKGRVSFFHKDFKWMFHQMKEKSDVLIYCDPPYIPMGASNFSYTGEGFKFRDQQELKNLAKSSKHTVVISNHWNDITKELYKDADEVYTFPVQRTISCKGGGRVQVMECVVVYLGEGL